MSETSIRILLISQYFYPENFKSNDIAFELSKKGIKVEVLTSIPNYPKGKYYKGYGIFKKRVEEITNVKIYRAFQFSRGFQNNFRIALSYISYAIFSSFWSLIFTLYKKYDCIIVHQTSPITQALPALVYNKFRNTPIFLWVLDIWPEAFVSGSNIKSKILLKHLYWFTAKVYKNSTKILISSKGFKSSILEKGNFEHKITYFPNWSIDFKINNLNIKHKLPELPDGFLIMFAGNIGTSQDVESVLKLAQELKENRDIKFVFVGDGSKRKWLENQIVKLELTDVVYLLGHYPLEVMPKFYEKANAMLLTLSGKFDDLSLYTPAKLQSYMSAGKPILGMINGTAREIIEEANCGYVVNAGDYKKLAHIINNVVFQDLGSFKKLGINGRKFYDLNFTLQHCIDNLFNMINTKTLDETAN